MGYKEPPEEYCFKPGVSGNPRGRPRGSKNFTSLLSQRLDEPVAAAQPGKKIDRRKAFVMDLVDKAVAGDVAAIIKVIRFMQKLDNLPEPWRPNPKARRTTKEMVDAAFGRT